MTNKQTFCFMLFGLSYLISLFFPVFSFHWLLKIIPIGILIFSVSQEFFNTTVSSTKNITLFLFGLVFSMFGDIFLAINPQELFIFGLGSFLIAHLLYIVSFAPFKRKSLTIPIIYIVLSISLLTLLYSQLAELFLPVVIYLIVLVAMALATYFSQRSSTLLVFGGFCFMLSDSLIAFDKFYTPIQNASLYIMFSYYLAQYCLVNGYLKKK